MHQELSQKLKTYSALESRVCVAIYMYIATYNSEWLSPNIRGVLSFRLVEVFGLQTKRIALIILISDDCAPLDMMMKNDSGYIQHEMTYQEYNDALYKRCINENINYQNVTKYTWYQWGCPVYILFLPLYVCNFPPCNKISYLTKYKVCAGCRGPYYCSKKCQTDDYREHRKECKKLEYQNNATYIRRITNAITNPQYNRDLVKSLQEINAFENRYCHIWKEIVYRITDSRTANISKIISNITNCKNTEIEVIGSYMTVDNKQRVK